MTGRHETAAVDAMKACANAWAGDDYPLLVRDAAADVLLAGSLVPALIASGQLALALADTAKAADAGEKALRAAITEAMSLGVTSVNLPHHVLSLVDGKQSAVVTDPALLPDEYMEQPPPRPNLHAIAKALKAGPVPGAALRNGAPHVRIVPRREVAA